MNILSKVEKIRERWATRMDADEENKNNEESAKKHSSFSVRLPYGLCKDVGIDTEGMTPREAWDAYYEKTGKSHDEVASEKMGGHDGKKPERAPELKEEVPAKKTYSTMTADELNDAKKSLSEEWSALKNDLSDKHKLSLVSLESMRKFGTLDNYLDKYYPDAKEEAGEALKKADEVAEKLRDVEYAISKAGQPEPKTEAEKAYADYEKAAYDEKWGQDRYGYSSEDYTKLKDRKRELAKEWANKFVEGGCQIETDLSGKSNHELDDEYRKLSEMDKAVAYIDDTEKEFEAVSAISDAQARIVDHLKDRAKTELGLDNEELTEETLASMKDSEVRKLSSNLKKDIKTIEDSTYYYNTATGKAYSSLISDARNKLSLVKNELDKRNEVKYQKKWTTVGEAKESTPTYTKLVTQEYADLVDPPQVVSGIKTLDGWQGHADSYMNQRAYGDEGDYKGENKNTLWGLDTEELVNLQRNLQNIFDNGELCVNINTENVDKVLDGHLKNQFETGTTDGSTDLEARRDLSANLFGTPKGINKEDREKYGYMADKDDFDNTLGSNGPWYGKDGSGTQCTLVFRKDNVANRTTYTFDDSLAAHWDHDNYHYAAGMVDTSCSIEGCSYNTPKAERIAKGEVKNIKDMFHSSGDYLECQYHGGVTAKDIEQIRFRSKEAMENALSGWSENALKTIKENGIRLRAYDKYAEQWDEYDADGNKIS